PVDVHRALRTHRFGKGPVHVPVVQQELARRGCREQQGSGARRESNEAHPDALSRTGLPHGRAGRSRGRTTGRWTGKPGKSRPRGEAAEEKADEADQPWDRRWLGCRETLVRAGTPFAPSSLSTPAVGGAHAGRTRQPRRQ